MSSATAKKYFAENIRLFADPGAQPEKYNLYNGLFGLAETMQQIESRLEEISRDLRYLKTRR